MNAENKIVGIGYNGMPNGCSDDLLPWRRTAENILDTKYPYGRALFVFRSTYRPSLDECLNVTDGQEASFPVHLSTTGKKQHPIELPQFPASLSLNPKKASEQKHGSGSTSSPVLLLAGFSAECHSPWGGGCEMDTVALPFVSWPLGSRAS